MMLEATVRYVNGKWQVIVGSRVLVIKDSKEDAENEVLALKRPAAFLDATNDNVDLSL
jgi:hypothetical protein